MKKSRRLLERRAGSRAWLGSLPVILVLVGLLFRSERKGDETARQSSAAYRSPYEDLAEQPTKGIVGPRLRTLPTGGKVALAGFIRKLERLCETGEGEWDALGRQYGALVADLSEAERRDLSDRIGRAAACSDLTVDRFGEIESWFVAFYERVAFCDGLMTALPVDRLCESVAICSGLYDESLRRRFLEKAGQRLAESDWGAAVTWLESVPEDRESESARTGVLSVWAEQDPESLLAWSEEHQQPQAAELATAALARAAVESDPRKGLEMAVDLSPSTARTRAMNYALSRWAAEDFDEVIRWGEEAEDTVVKGLALLAAVGAWTRADAEGAEAWIESWTDPAALRVREMARQNVRQFSAASFRGGMEEALGDVR